MNISYQRRFEHPFLALQQDKLQGPTQSLPSAPQMRTGSANMSSRSSETQGPAKSAPVALTNPILQDVPSQAIRQLSQKSASQVRSRNDAYMACNMQSNPCTDGKGAKEYAVGVSV